MRKTLGISLIPKVFVYTHQKENFKFVNPAVYILGLLYDIIKMQKGVKIMKIRYRDPANMPIFNDPYLADTNAPRDKAVRRQYRMINFWVKEDITDDSVVLPMSTGEKIRRGILIFLGICVAAAAIVCGIYVVRYWSHIR